ncbi:MAG: hypothetical protein LUF92_04510 [Clostridiales bacterium]|nr:hypothetical protein [Clostridiales bacterium]
MEKKEQKWYCNSCGKEIILEPAAKREDYLEIRKEWGYFSKKDGEIHRFVLCESCYDKLTEHFQIPVEVSEVTEWI